MGLREFFLWQLEHEVGTSRKVIERVPEGQNSWKPHDRSMELGYLAALVASMPGWIEFMVNLPADPDQHLRGIMNHIALGVPDIQAAREQLVKNGVHLTEEPKLGRDGKWQLNLYDPDQTRIEFMEFTPKEKPCCSEYTGPHPKP